MSNPTVLYVDDEPINIKLFDINFKKHCTLHTASSGAKGLEMIKEIDVDLIISDFKMPEMNGAEFITQSKDIKKNTKCYLLSAYPESEIIKITKGNSAIDGYVAKPWNRDQIIQLFG